MENKNKKQKRLLSDIAYEIYEDWGDKINSAAKPYLSIIVQLNYITDYYGCDSAYIIVTYFLANASTWRGETARRIKAELKGML